MFSIKKERNPVMLSVGIVIITLQGVIGFFLLQVLSQVRTLNGTYRTVMVDDIAGSAYQIVSFSSTQERHPDTIKNFSSFFLHTVFNSSLNTQGNAQGAEGEPQTFKVKTQQGEAEITPEAWAGGFMVNALFRPIYQAKMATLTTKEMLTGQQKSLIEVSNISDPQLVNTDKPGVWNVQVDAVRTIYDSGNTAMHQAALRWILTVEATDVPVVPQGKSALEKQVYTFRQLGLEITAIQEKNWENLAQ